MSQDHPTTDDETITSEAQKYADRVWRDDSDSRDAYMMGVRFALEKKATEVKQLRALIPSGDYVLTEDMDEALDKRYGRGLFANYDSVKSVS